MGLICYRTTSILLLREIMPHYGIFVMIRGGGYKLSEHFYSAPSRNYAPILYICHDWGWGIRLSEHFYSAPLRVYAPIWYICQKWGWGYKLSDHFYSAPSRV